MNSTRPIWLGRSPRLLPPNNGTSVLRTPAQHADSVNAVTSVNLNTALASASLLATTPEICPALCVSGFAPSPIRSTIELPERKATHDSTTDALAHANATRQPNRS